MATDDLAGFTEGQINFQIDIRNPAGQEIGSTYPVWVSGTSTDAIFSSEFEVPQYSVGGTYHVASFGFTDVAGNGAWMSEEDLAARGFSTTFENG